MARDQGGGNAQDREGEGEVVAAEGDRISMRPANTESAAFPCGEISSVIAQILAKA
jgi:hypothetical protein